MFPEDGRAITRLMKTPGPVDLQPDHTAIFARDDNRCRTGATGLAITLVAGPHALKGLPGRQRLGQFAGVLDVDKQSATVGRFGDAGHFRALGSQHLLADQHKAYLALARTSC